MGSGGMQGAVEALLRPRSVFAYSPFIDTAEGPCISAPGPGAYGPALREPAQRESHVPPLQWQAAVGRRVLTPQEQAARELHFERKAADMLAGLARRAS